MGAGRSRCLQTPVNGSGGVSSTGLSCRGCLYEMWRSWWKGAPLICSTGNVGSSLIALHPCCSLCLHPGYDDFRSRLERSLSGGLAFPTTDDEEIEAVQEVLQTERDTEVVDEAGQPHAKVHMVDKALRSWFTVRPKSVASPPVMCMMASFTLLRRGCNPPPPWRISITTS